MSKYFSLIFLIFLLGKNAIAQQPQPTPKERAVQLSATTQTNPPAINLQWVADNGATKYIVHRKSLNATSWGNPIAVLPGSSTTFTDNNVQVGVGYEYAFFKEDFSYRRDTVCIPSGTQMQFTINDSNGIGVCCSFGDGFYEIKNCNSIVASGAEFGFSETTNFTACNDGSGCSEIYITVKPSMIENSTYWTLTNSQNGQTIANGGGPGQFIRPRPEYGFIYAGIELPPIEDRGRILLVVENDMVSPLANEIEELKMDFIKDGWRVSTINVDKNDAISTVHNSIKNVYNSNPDLNTVLLLGHVPVAYSGSIFPDTHTENEGAYPADVYYGEMDGGWTDNVVNTTAPFLNIYHNVPGDGKFDQATPPSGVVELQVGRVDFFNMPAFSQNETQLLQQYLNKNHQFKTRQINPIRRALIDDNIGQTIGAPAASGWRNFSTMFGANNVAEADYFSTMSSQSYLWSYGAGSGNANSAAGVGTVQDFANSNLQNVFTMMFGSQFGNWAFTDNLLRAPLASGQTLTNCYSGNPPWVMHHMSMGFHIGHSLEQTQNNPNDVYLPYGAGLVSTALMGDPTLRMHMVQPPSNLQISNNSNSVGLNWNAPNNESVQGYQIYRASSVDGTFQKLNNNTITGTSFTDNSPLNGDNFYLVKTLKLETTGSGTYYNLSLGILGNTNFLGTSDTTPPTASLSTSNPNVTAPFIVNIDFSENVNGVELSDFLTSNGTASNLSGGGNSYSLTVSPTAGGNVTIVLQSQTVLDLAGNLNNNPSNILTVNYSPIIIDTTPPTAMLSTSNPNVTALFSININFSESVNGVELTDFLVTNGTVSSLTGSGSFYSLTVSPIASGNVTIVLQNQTVVDLAGNLNNNPSNVLTVNFTPSNTGGCTTPINLALNKPATQHSIQFNATAARANDGNTNGDFWGTNSTSLTNWDNQTWWEVDLGGIADVDEIRVFNRTDCCQGILSNYYVLISDNQFVSADLGSVLSQAGVSSFLQNTQAGTPSNIPINTTGRYIKIQLADAGFLSLAEVEVMGCFSNGGGQQDQTISFSNIPNKLTSDGPFSINATASSGLPVSFSIISGPAIINNNTITLTGGTGIVEVQASQNGDSQFNPAQNVTQSFTVSDNTGGGCSTPTNISLGKIASQSGTQLDAEANRAIDGITDGNFWVSNSVTLTNWVQNAWWEVDLGEISDIETINIFNRTDCCENIFGNFHLFVSDVPFNSPNLSETINQNGVFDILENGTAGLPSIFNINRTGRYVRIQLVGQAFLAIAEVEIMGCQGGTGCPDAGTTCDDNNANTENDMEDGNCNCAGTPISTSCSSLSNLALNQSTSQSSTLNAAGISGSSSKAVDGNSNGIFFTNPISTSSVTATNNELQPWWEVDLGNIFSLEEIIVFNRTDGQDRSQNCYVLVSDIPFSSNDLTTARSEAIFEQYLPGLVGSPSSIPINVDGRYVRIQMEGSGHLVLAEVEVMGCDDNLTNTSTLIAIPQTIDFEAVKSNEAVKLLWSTNLNNQTDHFIIEKSLDGNTFEFFQKIENYSNNFGFVFKEEKDESPNFGTNFYRLKLVQKDGAEIFSNVRQVRFEIDLSQIFIFPNPAKDEIWINLKPYLSKRVSIQVFDARGVLQIEKSFEKLTIEKPRINLRKIENGFYFMKIKVEGFRDFSIKFVVDKTM